MQSIHDSDQHRPIISMEDFMAQVAWPRVQPSPLGGGEAFTAQEPQPKPQMKVAPEATPKATPQASPVTTPGVEVSEEEDYAAYVDYAADMTVA